MRKVEFQVRQGSTRHLSAFLAPNSEREPTFAPGPAPTEIRTTCVVYHLFNGPSIFKKMRSSAARCLSVKGSQWQKSVRRSLLAITPAL